MKIRTCAIAAVAATAVAAIVAPSAFAASVTAKASMPWRQNVTVYLDGNAETVAAGQLDWVEQGTGRNFPSFCIDLESTLNTNTWYTWDKVALGDARSDSLIGGTLSTDRVNLLELFWGQNYGKVIDKATAATFQLGVWELVYDGDMFSDSLLTSFDTGLFRGTNGLWTSAKSWLTALDLQGERTSLAGLTHPTLQDQVTVAPTPGAASAGAALIALMIFRRRRTA